uniref:(R)-specific secondary-alkylsulfatase n=1 Tax=Pseudomonas sp. TaxID=306 RepID=RSAKS_PSESP|nr:RecName: Full=(R)-specific secondary-alkylsulfatase; Short=(R)-specific sec-alkylsulfatase; AltName: Full=Inverting sec-alkylsulfatase Pisa1; AltName: Full=Inverting secondary alkylsulfatase 1; AltName: Full=Type III (R)-specific secondary-alkylsulfatase; Flags: Precursor [Pseudomonas sp.]CCA63329.1 sec-alkylsulfatase [Pseudomonas sp. DSM 6611]
MSRFIRASQRRTLLATLIAATLAQPLLAAESLDSKPASAITAAKNAEVLKNLPFADREEFEAAKRGLIAPFSGQIKNAEGQVVWDMGAYQFLNDKDAADTVNPSLWHQAQLNNIAGLFEVMPKLYQVRGLDPANMTIIEGDSGLVLIDTLTTAETARAALDLYFQHRPKKPIVAVVYSHSHIDHFGGARGIIDEADVKAGKVKVFAPSGFMEHAVSENILAGTAMARRGQYQSGVMVPRGAQAQVDSGLFKTTATNATNTLVAPNVLIEKPYERHTVDGVELEFQLTLGSEAPSDMNIYLPQFKVLNTADNAPPAMHNLLTPRGAEVRDAKAWAGYIDASLEKYGDRTDVLIQQHNWPVWGGDKVRTYLADQRDMYAFLNNRALNLMNKGLTLHEIAAEVSKLPGELDRKWYLRSYYGALSTNLRAVYQRYLGFYDGNPANLDPFPPVEAGKRYVEAMGGADAVLKQMRAAIDKGDYRWAVQLGNHLVFADPANKDARALQADAMEQLGYQTENALWRNMYMTGAMELRHGVPTYDSRGKSEMGRALTPDMFFDLLAIRLDTDKAVGHDMTLNWVFEDLKQDIALTLRNGVLTQRVGSLNPKADVTVKLTKPTLDQIAARKLDLPTAIKQGTVKLDGDGKKLGEFFGLLDSFSPKFNIVEPLE